MRSTGHALVFAAAAALCTATAAANGINPPQLNTQVVVTATCTPRAEGEIVQIFRAKLAPGSESGALVLKAPDAAQKAMPLARIESMRVPEGTADAEGFVKATIRLRSDAQEQEVLVAVRRDGEPVQLKGFLRSGKAAGVELAACREVLFADPDKAPAPDQPRAKAS